MGNHATSRFGLNSFKWDFERGVMYCLFIYLFLSHQLSLTKHIMSTDAAGKSGARLYLSCDKRYFIKTLVSEEVEMMHHMLKQYHQVSKCKQGERVTYSPQETASEWKFKHCTPTE